MLQTKIGLSQLNNNTDAVRLSITFEEVGNLITSSSWSCALFNANYRNIKNFECEETIALDVDGGCTLDEALRLFAPYRHIIATTRNHQKDKKGVTCDRFRVILFLETPIRKVEDHYATWETLRQTYPFIDAACKDPSRLYFASREVVRSSASGLSVPVTHSEPDFERDEVLKEVRASDVTGGQRGRLANATLRFLIEGAPVGTRHNALVKALKDLKQNGFTIEEAKERLSGLDLMDAHAWHTVEDVYARDVKHGPRLPAGGGSAGSASTSNYVREFLIQNEVAVSFSRVLTMRGTILTREDVLRRMRLKRLEDNLIKIHRDQDMEDVFDEWIEATRLSHIESVREKVRGYDPAAESQLEALLGALTGRVDPVEVAVMRHWLWQVKRKLFGREVVEHIMPVLLGRQRSGKSYTIEKRLLKPFGELACKSGLKALADPREGRLLMDHFVVFFDELSGADKADVNELKRVLTSEVLKLRVMRQTHHETGLVNASFIAATNSPVQDMIKDDTGMRRFFEIQTVEEIDRAKINSIDFDLLWRAISEDVEIQDAPYYSVAKEIQARQETIRHRSPVEEWLEDGGQFEVVNDGTSWLTASEIFDEFARWYKGPLTISSFSRYLRRIPGVQKRRGAAGAQYNLRRAVKGGLKLVNGNTSEGEDF